VGRRARGAARALGQSADLVVVAPATADLLAARAHGLADDLLTNVLLTARCPVLLAPAMHTEMWEHPRRRANVATLRERGVRGRARRRPADRQDSGKGRLPDPRAARAACGAGGAGRGPRRRRVVVSAGGTREHLDPVRFLGNRSSGKQGLRAGPHAAARGAEVVLVTRVDAARPAGRHGAPVASALELHDAVLAEATAPTPSSWPRPWPTTGPVERLATKRKKTETLTVELVENPDVLAELVARAGPGRCSSGFAAETGDADGDVLAHGRAKLARKGCDLLVVNEVGRAGPPHRLRGRQQRRRRAGADGRPYEVPLGQQGRAGRRRLGPRGRPLRSALPLW
jgi:phosphopantothenoylcysteine decarboxylase/phosphopantothenate--cysteine ligase